jgi:hypothetical protein
MDFERSPQLTGEEFSPGTRHLFHSPPMDRCWSGTAAGRQTRPEGRLVLGIENAPQALMRLFAGENAGKQLLKIAEVNHNEKRIAP